MEITDIKKGTMFLGGDNHLGKHFTEVFEGIVLDVNNDAFRDISSVTMQTVVIKSNNPKNIGKMELFTFLIDDLEDYLIAPTHFVAMENLYKVLHSFNPSDCYSSFRFGQINSIGESLPIHSLFDEEEPMYSVAILQTNDNHYIQIIIQQETYCIPEYENKFVWINIVDDEKDLLIQQNVVLDAENLLVYALDDVKIEDCFQNDKLMSFFGDTFSLNQKTLNDFRGIGITKNNDLKVIIFDTATEEERVTWGNGIETKFEY